ncbi:MAG TPA: methionyl-tRNA formyltransferase [Thermoanaerobaculia bacterium]|jgi:methionyl-tRNA formyltransferase|nr:methionyl-tRNA formyltransferase [Thermoanaerobaculia bacterium]
MRIVFLGTPDFAVPALDAVAREHEVVLVIAQPDKPAGRGMKMHAPAVAVRARELGLAVLQPPRIRNEDALAEIARLAPDLGVVIAYGKILPKALLDIPKHGFLNVHASVLPQWRGAAPIQRSIEAGDRVTGVTIMRVDEDLDHGPMFAIETTEIDPNERTPALAARLSALGADALLKTLRDIENGVATETPQDHERATLAPKIEKSEGEIRFDESTRVIYDRFRAFDPWPGIFVQSGGETIKLTELRPAEFNGEPRTILSIEDDVIIATSGGALRISEMQRPGKPRTPAGAIARGLGWRVGERLP